MAMNMRHLTAMALVGDGLLALMAPAREARAWRMSPEPFRTMMSVISRKPELTRWVGAAQVGLGVWLVLRERPKSLSAAA